MLRLEMSSLSALFDGASGKTRSSPVCGPSAQPRPLQLSALLQLPLSNPVHVQVAASTHVVATAMTMVAAMRNARCRRARSRCRFGGRCACGMRAEVIARPFIVVAPCPSGLAPERRDEPATYHKVQHGRAVLCGLQSDATHVARRL